MLDTVQLETFKKMTILWVNLDQQKSIVCRDVAQNFDDIRKLNHKNTKQCYPQRFLAILQY